MRSVQKSLRIVQFKCPYDTWESAFTQKLYAQVITLKLDGYKKEYPYGVLPIDTLDLVANHLLVCEQKADGSLFPLMGYRSISFNRCKTHGQGFPLVTLMHLIQNPNHEESVKTAIHNATTNGHEIFYDSSWTIRPEVRENRELTEELIGIMKALHVLQHIDSPKVEEIMAGGVLRFKMERLYEYWGYDRLSFQGEALPPISMPYASGEKAILFHLKKFSPAALEYAKEFESMWKNRLDVTVEALELSKAS